MHGNPYLRLIRSEVEALVDEKYGKNYLNKNRMFIEDYQEWNRKMGTNNDAKRPH
ncbi:MAG: hypothetical protein L6243_02250 [Candidatus Altiarchaeales archaeon]|nr:hypothetical protein [Candidatus Altiarchaeota archaeon]MCG2782391.1 hypothetical protein [Candidatus Altiarchaeales archaeon]